MYIGCAYLKYIFEQIDELNNFWAKSKLWSHQGSGKKYLDFWCGMLVSQYILLKGSTKQKMVYFFRIFPNSGGNENPTFLAKSDI